jgi:DNA helicase IV
MTDPKVWKEERAYLAGAMEGLRLEIGEIDRRFDAGISAGDEAAEESIRRLLETRYRGLLRSQKGPYFARIDFTDQDGKYEKIYIGKTSVYDRENDLLVTDWRAPISGLYYNSRLGTAVYDSPDGLIEGVLSLKRRLTVEGGELKGIDDIDVTATDELLAPYLSVSADARLKSIIATIQSEQNRVIRAAMYRPLIVQGAAGSGKTTVALHRVAYLAYALGRRFRPEHFLVLSAGGFFLHYIAGILPDLGVEDVPQRSFEELVRQTARVNFRVEETEGYDGYKSSFDILNDIDAFLEEHPEVCGKRANALTAYKAFLKEEPRYRLKQEDLAPLLYLRLRAAGVADSRVLHVVIDEAQDFSAMQLAVLQMLFRKASFTILGDLAQGIYPYGVQGGWEDVNEQVWQGGADIVTLQKSYRATVEIMEAAGQVLDALPYLPKGEAVVRHGEPVGYTDVWGEDDRAAACAGLAQRRREQGYANIAVILSRPSDCAGFARLVNRHRTKADASAPPIVPLTSRDGRYEGGLCLLPAALAKGLEFDAVIVADAERYPKDALGVKLLYVAMTRAMHTLDVVREL